ncbi:putative N-acetyl-transferase [Seiridium cardinale]|uniref:N-acetyl-transferase n=1 Tax=Seiridium cardinale TaxID=138064 RepID=A0ABR2X6S3_9PEZI
MTTYSKVTVLTTLPSIENLGPIGEDYSNIIIRPLQHSDIEAYHSLGKNPVVSLNRTKPNTDLNETRARLERIIQTPLSEGVNFGVFLKNSDASEGDLIAEGGVKIFQSSWPEIYYIFRQDQKKSRGSFLNLMTNDFWFTIPREEKRLEVHSLSLPKGYKSTQSSIDFLCAEIPKDDEENKAIFEHSGYFELCGELPNTSQYWRHIPKVPVRTTFPITLDNLPLPAPTLRLIIRPVRPSDLEAYHSMMQVPEVVEGLLGSPSSSFDESQSRKWLFDPPSPSTTLLKYAIFLKNSEGNEGEFIGEGGMTIPYLGWPSLHYVFKKESWGLGYATEFVKAFMGYWWNEIPRENTQRQNYF